MRVPVTLDIENLVDWFEVKIKDVTTGFIYHQFHLYPGSAPLDRQLLVDILARVTIYTFNGIGYDLPILVLALSGAGHQTLKEAGDAIIVSQLKWWDFYNRYGLQVPEFIDHVDVMEVAAGVRIGLKMYAGRMHAPRMQDLPIDPNMPTPPAMRQVVSDYCDNDLEVTQLMREGLADRLALRVAMSEKYGVDLRSKSDAQMAEAVIKAKLSFKPDRRWVQHGYSFKYVPPAYVRFTTPALNQLLDIVMTSDFVVTDKEQAWELGIEDVVRTGVNIPPQLQGLDIVIGQSTYRLGIGGLHSQESSVSYYASDEYEIRDVDVTSYYPSLILQMGMTPEQLGDAFPKIYRELYNTRLTAKAEAARLYSLGEGLGGADGADCLKLSKEAQTESDGLKIVLNGTFGKLFSKYSILYAPEFGIATTITGQLSLLMLIEMMESTGIHVISANTDGIVLLIPKGMQWVVDSNVKWWERTTQLGMEATYYTSIHSRDVNNYIAFTNKGKVKRKGVYARPGLIENKHPDKSICSEAVVKFLQHGTPIADTILMCTDIREFVQVRAATGGAQWVRDGHAPVYLGKAVRWYYGTGKGVVVYVKSGNLVAGGENATPVMQLPDSLPADIDYQYYIDVSLKMLADLGVKTNG